MDLQVWTIIWRTLITYLLIIGVLRLMGKREIGELSVLDLVVFLMLAEIAVFSIEEPDNLFIHAVIPMIVLLIVQIGTAYLSLKSQRFRNWFDGRPSVIISRGSIDEREMRRQRYNFDDLLIQLRDKGIRNVQEVDFAILEPNGKLSVFEKTGDDDSGSEDETSGIAMVLVQDGEVQSDNLRKMKKSKAWLKKELRVRGHMDIKQVSYCTVDADDQWFIDIKDEK